MNPGWCNQHNVPVASIGGQQTAHTYMWLTTWITQKVTSMEKARQWRQRSQWLSCGESWEVWDSSQKLSWWGTCKVCPRAFKTPSLREALESYHHFLRSQVKSRDGNNINLNVSLLEGPSLCYPWATAMSWESYQLIQITPKIKKKQLLVTDTK